MASRVRAACLWGRWCVLACFACLAGTGDHSLGFSVKPHTQYLAVAVSDRYRDSLNDLALSELESSGFRNINFAAGRWYFDAGLRHSDARALAAIKHVASIRAIALRANLSTAKDPLSALELALLVDGAAKWNATLKEVAATRRCSPSTFRVVSRRSLPAGVEQELEKLLARRFGWRRQVRGRKADITIHLCASGGILQVEVPLLCQEKAFLGGGLPRPGLGHVEAWACARSLQIQSGDLVLDPMCGKGTLLAEAAVWWPSAKFVGCDVDKDQLDCCRSNFEWLQREVSLYHTDATKTGGIPFQDGSVDKILVAPPWNRQYRIQGDPEVFYRCMFKEILRVLHPAGRLVFLGASGKTIHKLEVALRSVQTKHRWSIVSKRSFFLTRSITGVMAVAENTASANSEGIGGTGWKALPWEGQAPENSRDLYYHWRHLRALAFPELRPASEPIRKDDETLRRHPSRALLVLVTVLLGLAAFRRQAKPRGQLARLPRRERPLCDVAPDATHRNPCATTS
ncbi:THUMPD2 [Symbiodinium sp. CCMP2592]|nr:THUMPD2 [Symbiodinium sp. CCMP2592]